VGAYFLDTLMVATVSVFVAILVVVAITAVSFQRDELSRKCQSGR